MPADTLHKEEPPLEAMRATSYTLVPLRITANCPTAVFIVNDKVDFHYQRKLLNMYGCYGTILQYIVHSYGSLCGGDGGGWGVHPHDHALTNSAQ